jgi:phospholipid/cholesterol/gamma-HCH transport system permease protein
MARRKCVIDYLQNGFAFASIGAIAQEKPKPVPMLDRADSSDSALPPTCEAVMEDGTLRIAVSGSWTLRFIEEAGRAAGRLPLKRGTPKPASLDLGHLQALDTAGSLALINLSDRLGLPEAAFLNARREHQVLLEEVARAAPSSREPPPAAAPISAFITRFILALTAIARDAVHLTMFLGQTAQALGRVIAKPSKFRGTAFIHQIELTGLTAIPIISLVCVLIGGVIMQQGARQLRNFGAETLSIDMLGILALREVGVVLAAVMVAGRSASAFTAQIGTMKMREEIDAMRTLGIDPIETLVLPRILALILVLPLLVFVADVMCLAGGAVMAKIYLALDFPVYLERLNSAVSAKHFYVGLIKAPFVALVIGLVGCLEGLRVEGSAESVGTQVTTAVVKAIFLVLVLDAVFAIFLSASGF